MADTIYDQSVAELRAAQTTWGGQREGYCDRVDLDLFGWFYCTRPAGHKRNHKWRSVRTRPRRKKPAS